MNRSEHEPLSVRSTWHVEIEDADRPTGWRACLRNAYSLESAMEFARKHSGKSPYAKVRVVREDTLICLEAELHNCGQSGEKPVGRIRSLVDALTSGWV